MTSKWKDIITQSYPQSRLGGPFSDSPDIESSDFGGFSPKIYPATESSSPIKIVHNSSEPNKRQMSNPLHENTKLIQTLKEEQKLADRML
jgi:hypothetical protein